MIKKIIFDIDNTILDSNKDYFTSYKKYIDKSKYTFTAEDLYNALEKFEKQDIKFSIKNILNFLKENLDKRINILDMINVNKYLSKEASLINENTEEILKYLSDKYELICVTNWTTKCQIKRMKKAGLAKYFKKIYGVDVLGQKPNVEVFFKACEPYQYNEVAIIGDSLKNDIEVPHKLGMKAILLSNEKHKKYESIDRIDKLKEML